MSIKFLDEQEMVCTCFSDEPKVDCPIHGVWVSSGPGEFVLPRQDFLIEVLKKAGNKPCTRHFTRKDIENGLREIA